jgi:WD40 repeat protein
LSQDGRRAAFAAGGYLWVFDVEADKVLGLVNVGEVVKKHPFGGERREKNRVYRIWFSEDGSSVYFFAESGKWKWDYQAGQKRPENAPKSLEQLDSGLFVANQEGRIEVLGKDGKPLGEVVTKDKYLALSIDGTLLATSQRVGQQPGAEYIGGYNVGEFKISVWNVARGSPVFSFVVSPSVEQTSFSPNNRYLAVGSSNGMVRVFDVAEHKEMARLPHRVAIRFLAFNADSSELISQSSGSPGYLFLSPLNYRVLVQAVCRRSIHDLTEREWREYVGEERQRPICQPAKD